MEQDEEEEGDDTPIFPFFSHYSFLSSIARLRAEEEEIEMEMIQSAMSESMDTYHQSLFRKNSRLHLNLISFIVEKEEGQCYTRPS
jgi:hypothetical protein